jgi:hypothetical protein
VFEFFCLHYILYIYFCSSIRYIRSFNFSSLPSLYCAIIVALLLWLSTLSDLCCVLQCKTSYRVKSLCIFLSRSGRMLELIIGFMVLVANRLFPTHIWKVHEQNSRAVCFDLDPGRLVSQDNEGRALSLQFTTIISILFSGHDVVQVIVIL